MTDAESPGTLFELLYLFFTAAGGMLRVIYDNACNFLNYALNRDPAWAQSVRVFIDALHFKGHTCCATSLDGGVFLELHPCSTTTSSLDGSVLCGRCLATRGLGASDCPDQYSSVQKAALFCSFGFPCARRDVSHHFFKVIVRHGNPNDLLTARMFLVQAEGLGYMQGVAVRSSVLMLAYVYLFMLMSSWTTMLCSCSGL
jgi:hypothetical protein